MKYAREIIDEGGDSLSLIASKIAGGSLVLDLGIGSGTLGRFLTAERGCRVHGVDLDEAFVRAAAGAYERVAQADLEQEGSLAAFTDSRYDAIVIADVLEHVRNPDSLLRQATDLLADGGRLLLSVPNVAYAGVVLELLEGRFEYRDEGLLDTTHVRFYTLDSLRKLLIDCGLHMHDLDAVKLPLHRSEFEGAVPERLPRALRDVLATRPDSLVYQYIVSASPATPHAEPEAPSVDFENLQGQFEVSLYHMLESDLDFSEDRRASRLAALGGDQTTLSWEIDAAQNIDMLRYCPGDRPGVMHIDALELVDPNTNSSFDLLDTACLRLEDSTCHGLALSRAGRGFAARLMHDSGWFEIDLRRISGLSQRRQLELRVTQGWPRSQDYVTPDQLTTELAARLDSITNELLEHRAHRRGLVGEVEALKQALAEKAMVAQPGESRARRLPRFLERWLLRGPTSLLPFPRKLHARDPATGGRQTGSRIEVGPGKPRMVYPVPRLLKARIVHFSIASDSDHPLVGPHLFEVVDQQTQPINTPMYVDRRNGRLFGTLWIAPGCEVLEFAASRLQGNMTVPLLKLWHIPQWVHRIAGSWWHWLWFYRVYGAGWVFERWREELALIFENFPKLGKRRQYQDWWKKYGEPDSRRHTLPQDRLRSGPLVSVLMPVYNTEPRFLERAIESVLQQSYQRWELCIADDNSTAPATVALLKRYESVDPRIRVAWREENGHISAATNTALALAGGDYVAFLDHDDELAPVALEAAVSAFQDNHALRLLYTDEHVVDENGNPVRPHFKPDWNPDYFLSVNYFCHLVVAERELVNSVGGLREGYEGAQDYDLLLRMTRQLTANAIGHLPRVLYQWRAASGSTAQDMDSKDYALEAGRKALEDHLAAKGIEAEVQYSELGTAYRVRYALPQPEPTVSIIIPTRNELRVLRHCIDSITSRTGYANYEIVVVDNQSDDPDTLAYLDELSGRGGYRVLRYDHPFNFAAMMNFAVNAVASDVVLLLNNDMEVINGDWLEEMVSHAVREGIGAVGAKLLFASEHIQHAGVLLGLGPDKVAGHAFKGMDRHDIGHMSRLRLIQDYSAVTGACMAVRRELYQQVGGMDAEQLKIAFNDVDFCLKLGAAGYRNLWTPYAQLYHFESYSRGYDVRGEKRARYERERDVMRERWGQELDNDPCYNPNLTQQFENFDAAWPPRGRGS